MKATSERRLDPPYLVDEGLVRVVGLSGLCSFETTIKIPAQWQHFMAYYDAIPAKLDRIPVGVNQPANDEGQFQYMCAVEVSTFGESPKELLQLEIPPRKYAVFEHRGHVSTLYESYSTIWNEALPARGWTAAEAPGIERHSPTFDPRTGEGGLSLWIPLAD